MPNFHHSTGHMRSFIIGLGLSLSSMTLWSQTYTDRPLVIADGPLEQRQLLGAPASSAPTEVLSSATEQAGVHRFNASVSSSTWDVPLVSLTDARPGTQLVLIAPEMGSEAVLIGLNGNLPLPLEWVPGEAVLGTDLDAGTAVSVIYTGSSFQMLNGAELRRRDCPSGMAAVNTQYCIDQNENTASDLVQASITCATAGKRLCYWGEYHAACVVSASLGITSMTDNWEWTNNTSNEDNSVRRVGYGSCTNAGNGLMTGSATFHCCFTR